VVNVTSNGSTRNEGGGGARGERILSKVTIFQERVLLFRRRRKEIVVPDKQEGLKNGLSDEEGSVNDRKKI